MDAMTEDTRLPVDIDAQPVVQAAVALQPTLRAIMTRSSVNSACRRLWWSNCTPPASTEW